MGDFGSALGIFLIFYLFGTVNYSEVFDLIPYSLDRIYIFRFKSKCNKFNLYSLFIGAMGKFTNFFHTWLPDAIGPTPVSALIHAATMVTAGVFLVVRCSPIYEYFLTLNLITLVGMSTLFCCISGISANDIKNNSLFYLQSVRLYVFAAGVGAYNVAMFHLFTHAFLKLYYF